MKQIYIAVDEEHYIEVCKNDNYLQDNPEDSLFPKHDKWFTQKKKWTEKKQVQRRDTIRSVAYIRRESINSKTCFSFVSHYIIARF